MREWDEGHEPRAYYATRAAELEKKCAADASDDASQMRWSFELDDAGLIWVATDPAFPGFAAVLADAVGPLSPQGEPPALSTYWIDRTVTWIAENIDAADQVELAAGNSTALVQQGGAIEAVALYETFPTEVLSADEVLRGLLAWRRMILDRVDQVGAAVPVNDAGAVVGMRPPPH